MLCQKLILKKTLIIVKLLTGWFVLSVLSTQYKGDSVLEVHVRDEFQMTNFRQLLREFVSEASRWRVPVINATSAHVHVKAKGIERFTRRLQQYNLKHKIIIDDLQKHVDEERISNNIQGLQMPWESSTEGRHRQKRNSDAKFETVSSIVGKYATYEEIMDWMKYIEQVFPDNVKVINIGKTYEGRDISLLKISFEDGNVAKPGLWIDGGTHAREWISPSSVVYIVFRILTAYYNRNVEETIARSVDWYILPVLNPDGYAFTFDPNGNRFWRKNRSQYGENAIDSYSTTYNLTCHGSDINRNYDFQWRKVNPSTDPCLETYTGPAANSEKETQAVTSFLLNNRDLIRGYVTIHSYGQYFFTRWSYSQEVQAPYYSETLTVAQEAVKAINSTHGIAYEAGISSKLMYAFSGGSGDWAREKVGIKHAYEVEVRDKGNLGFNLPVNYTIPVGEEMWAAVKVVASHVLQDYPWTTKSTKVSTSALGLAGWASSTPGLASHAISTPGLASQHRSLTVFWCICNAVQWIMLKYMA